MSARNALDRESDQVMHLLDRGALPDHRAVCGRPIAAESIRVAVTYTRDPVTFRRSPRRCAPCGRAR